MLLECGWFESRGTSWPGWSELTIDHFPRLLSAMAVGFVTSFFCCLGEQSVILRCPCRLSQLPSSSHCWSVCFLESVLFLGSSHESRLLFQLWWICHRTCTTRLQEISDRATDPPVYSFFGYLINFYWYFQELSDVVAFVVQVLQLTTVHPDFLGFDTV